MRSKKTEGPVPDTGRDLAIELTRGVLRLARRLRSERADQGLGANALGVLVHLRLNGPSSPSAIAAAERHQPQSLTRVLAELERQGMVSRSSDAADGRKVLLSITPAGTLALQKDVASRGVWLARSLEQLSELERQALAMAAPILERLAQLDPSDEDGAADGRA